MSKATLKRRLALANERIGSSARRLMRVKRIIAELERGGQTLEAAREIVAQFEELQAQLKAERDSIQQGLSQIASKSHRAD